MLKGFKTLPRTKKVLWGLGVLLAPLFIVSAVSPTPDMQKAAQVNQSDFSEASSSQPASTEAPTPQPQAMKAEIKPVTEAVAIPFSSTTQEDATLEAGKMVVAVAGVNGEKLVTYEVTYTAGAETSRKPVSEQVTKAPINEIKKVGAKAKKLPLSKCHPNYADACVPIASDVDCRGGPGNGPAYVKGPLRVTGFDVYHLDRDGNGVGCE